MELSVSKSIGKARNLSPVILREVLNENGETSAQILCGKIFLFFSSTARLSVLMAKRYSLDHGKRKEKKNLQR